MRLSVCLNVTVSNRHLTVSSLSVLLQEHLAVVTGSMLAWSRNVYVLVVLWLLDNRTHIFYKSV